MSAGKLEIYFDGVPEGEPRFEPGSAISGKAVFTPSSETTLNSVKFSVGWVTRGRGAGDTGEAWSNTLYMPEGSRVFGPGQAVSWPFRCQLPESPWSYGGKYVVIAWEVGVQLDIPLARDPHAKRGFVLRPG
jgi:hypothetical protein